jgi:hypothetical protein
MRLPDAVPEGQVGRRVQRGALQPPRRGERGPARAGHSRLKPAARRRADPGHSERRCAELGFIQPARPVAVGERGLPGGRGFGAGPVVRPFAGAAASGAGDPPRLHEPAAEPAGPLGPDDFSG